MLVLSRKANETIRIADNVCITVVAIEGGIVKLGIQAPPEVAVHRGEVYERIQEENRKAASGTPPQMPVLAQCWQAQRKAGTGEVSSREKSNS